MEFSNTNDVRGKRSIWQFNGRKQYSASIRPFFTRTKPTMHFRISPICTMVNTASTCKPCKSAEAVRNGHTDAPHEHTVKQECNNGLAAGAQSEISRMEKCILRHKDGHDHNEIFRQLSVHPDWSYKALGKTAQPSSITNRNSRTAHNGKCDHLIIRISCFLHISRPQTAVPPQWQPNLPRAINTTLNTLLMVLAIF